MFILICCNLSGTWQLQQNSLSCTYLKMQQIFYYVRYVSKLKRLFYLLDCAKVTVMHRIMKIWLFIDFGHESSEFVSIFFVSLLQENGILQSLVICTSTLTKNMVKIATKCSIVVSSLAESFHHFFAALANAGLQMPFFSGWAGCSLAILVGLMLEIIRLHDT